MPIFDHHINDKILEINTRRWDGSYSHPKWKKWNIM